MRRDHRMRTGEIMAVQILWVQSAICGYFIFGIPLALMSQLGIPLEIALYDMVISVPYSLALVCGMCATSAAMLFVRIGSEEHWNYVDSTLCFMIGIIFGLLIGIFCSGIALFTNFWVGLVLAFVMCALLLSAASSEVEVYHHAAVAVGILLSMNMLYAKALSVSSKIVITDPVFTAVMASALMLFVMVTFFGALQAVFFPWKEFFRVLRKSICK